MDERPASGLVLVLAPRYPARAYGDRLVVAGKLERPPIYEGFSYREIGEQLYISPKTVENHVSSVLRKLQLSNRYELSRWAQDRKLI